MKTYGENATIRPLEAVPALLRWVEPNSRVLEFGPAFGYMTRYMKEELRCQVTCIELNPAMEPTLRQYAEKVIIADIDSGNWERELEGRFDFILFSDVLEHLRNPLQAMRKAICFGDCVLTSVPNVGHSSILLCLLDGKFPYQTYGLLDDTHVHLFTRESVEEMMNACSFQCVDDKSSIALYPFNTEFHVSYAQHLLAAWPIGRKPDSSVYQFINKYERVNEDEAIRKSIPLKLSFLKLGKVIVLDTIMCYFTKYQWRNKTLSKIWRKICYS